MEKTIARVNGLKYSKKFNLGNYESEEICVDVSVPEGEDPGQVLESMMTFVKSQGRVPLSQVEQISPAAEAAKEEAKAEKAAAKAEKKAAQVKDKSAAKEETVMDKVEEKAAEAVTEKADKTEKKTFKAKPANYDRALDLHKKLVSEMLDANVPGWKAKASKAKEVSESLAGEAFLDAEGKVIAAFKDKFVAKMK
jgi:hypothetical protein